jgi:chromate reductase
MQRQKKHIVCIAGSLRRHSWNRRLLLAARSLAPPGLTLEVYEHLHDVPMFNEDIEPHPVPGVLQLRAAVLAADGLLLATAEYNHSLPSVLKNAIDWLSRGEPSCLRGKPVAVIGATPGAWGTRLAQAALRQTLFAIGARVMVEPMLFVARASSCFNEQGELIDASVAHSLADVLAAVESWVDAAR